MKIMRVHRIGVQLALWAGVCSLLAVGGLVAVLVVSVDRAFEAKSYEDLGHVAELVVGQIDTFHATVESALAWARTRTLIPVRPKLSPWQDKLMIVLPWDPDYDHVPVAEGEAIATDHPVVTQPISRFILEEGLWRADSGLPRE